MPPKFRRPPPPQATGSANETPDDEDMFFSRNTKGLAGIKVDNIASPTKSSRDSSGSDDMSPATKRHKGKSGKKASDWTKPGAVIALDSDSEPEILSDRGRQKSSSSPSRAKGKGKGKAKAVRERSLTPPPAIPQHALQEAKRVVRAVLFSGNRHGDPEMEPEVSDIEMVEEEIDPEVKAMLESARERDQATLRSHAYDVQSPGYNDPSSPLKEPEEEENQEWIKLKVSWKGTPREDGKTKWAFRFNLHAPFRRLSEMLQPKVELTESELILAHNSRRILLGATPKSLRMRKDTSETIDLYPKLQWDVEGHSNTPLTSPRVEDTIPVPIASVSGTASASANKDDEEDNDDEARDDVLVLNIRSVKYPDHLTISAKRTAKSSSVLTKYLKRVGEDVTAYDVLGDPKARGKTRVKLSFDGEELTGNTPVGDTDADNDDVWDVVGL